ncbi:unnamed protein product, partial [Heterotrigona itama]
KIYLILGLLCMGANGEKKINLDDIERDNLRAEGISKSGITQFEGSKYLTKPVIGQQQYQIPNQYRGPLPPSPPPSSSSVTYVTPPPVQNYPTETYVQPSKYAKKEQVYQQQNNYQEQILPQRYYHNEYQQQPLLFPKRTASNVYESQQLAYQPEVNIGNQLQSVQQKVVSSKFTKNANKDQEYINIPMMHLLTYYPNLNVNSGKTNGLFVPQLATTTNHISIPVYTSTLSQRPVVSVRPTYEIQYTPKHNAVSTVASNKVTKGAAYTAPVNSKKFSSSPTLSVPTDAPADQTYAQGRQFLYTQAYVAPSQPQYVSQLVYAQPTAVYMQATPVYSDVYVHPSNYDQDNSLQGSARYTTPVEQLQSTVAIADELPNQGLGQQSSQQSVTQNYIKDEPDEPNTDLVPPEIPPQDFKSDTASVSPQDELLPEQDHVTSSEPRSLLDSYVPSNVIAAQDSS